MKKIKVALVRTLRYLGLKEDHVPSVVSRDRIEAIRIASRMPLKDDRDIKRVEICMLKYKEDPQVIDPCISNVVHRTQWPFKLTIFDNRPNPPNMAKAWNHLARQATCEYVCIMDTDAYVPDVSPCWLTRMMESIEEKGVVVPLGDNVSGINKALSPKEYPNASVQPGAWTGFFFLFKKSLWEKEPFDEDFYVYGQDAEWAARLTEKYGGVVLREDVLVHHLHGYSTKKAQKKGELDREADHRYAAQLFKDKDIEKYF